MGAFEYNGLVIVHPVDGTPKNADYKQNLRNIVAHCRKTGKPVFWERDPGVDPEIEDILFDAEEIFNGENDRGISTSAEKLRDCYQRTADLIARRTRKGHSEVRLGFGGTNADECVYTIAIMLCREVETNYPPKKPKVNALQTPLGYARVLDEIV